MIETQSDIRRSSLKQIVTNPLGVDCFYRTSCDQSRNINLADIDSGILVVIRGLNSSDETASGILSTAFNNNSEILPVRCGFNGLSVCIGKADEFVIDASNQPGSIAAILYDRFNY